MTMSTNPFDFLTQPATLIALAGLALWCGLVTLMVVAF